MVSNQKEVQCDTFSAMFIMLVSLHRKMPIREFYLDRVLAELELSHDEVSSSCI